MINRALSYAIYQSEEAANAMMLAMEILPPEKFSFNDVHFVSDELAMANLDMAERLSELNFWREYHPFFI